MKDSLSYTVAIIGAGPSGLVLAKQLIDRNINFILFERDEDLGGVWNSANQHSVMYDSAHTISSKSMTEFSEFPMPEEYSDYISHKKMLGYLSSYAKKFDLIPHICFSCTVERVSKKTNGTYEVKLENGEIQTFQHVAVATGHASKPNIPKLNFDDFKGKVLHSSEYKEPSIFKNKNVLVIGAGNSACDIACEATYTAKNVFLSIRRGYYFIPKFLLGMPADVFGETSVKLRLPMRIRQKINQLILRFYQGDLQKLGFPKPDHRIFESHPIVNELLIYYVRQGDIRIYSDVLEVLPNTVKLQNDKIIAADIIILGTGYQHDFSYLENELQPNVEELYLNIFSKKHVGLSFLGLIDPNGGILGILESQAKAVAAIIALNLSDDKYGRMMNKNILLNGGIHYIKSKRHTFEVDHATYRREISRKIKEFEALILN